MYAIRILNVLLMICLPIGLAAYINTKFKTNWHLWWIGGDVFVLSQIGHIPFNYISGLILNQTNLINLPKFYQTLFNAFFLGLSAGLWEEIARYSAFRWWVGNKRTWKAGIQLGVGHGGFESLILGVLVFYTFIQMVAVRNIDFSTLVPADQLSQTIGAIASYWAAPWYDALLGGVERILTLPIQIALSVLVAQVFIRGNWRWMGFAILFHMVVDAIAVLLMSFSNVYITELAIAFFSAISIWIIFVLKNPEPIEVRIDENGLLKGSFRKIGQIS